MVDNELNTHLIRIAERLAALETKANTTSGRLDNIEADVKGLREDVNKAKGGWRTILIAIAVSSAVGGLTAKVLPFVR